MEESRTMQKANTRSQILDLVETMAGALPAELRTKLNDLLPQLLDEKEAEGKVAMIYESRYRVYKAVLTGPHSSVLFKFPPSTELDENAKSSDPAVAEKAKRLKAFEARLEEAFYDSPEAGRVIVHYTPKPGDDAGAVDAERITSISILV